MMRSQRGHFAAMTIRLGDAQWHWLLSDPLGRTQAMLVVPMRYGDIRAADVAQSLCQGIGGGRFTVNKPNGPAGMRHA